jgi:hypothetical protein
MLTPLHRNDFTSAVLGGPVSRRALGHRVLHHYEIVRHLLGGGGRFPIARGDFLHFSSFVLEGLGADATFFCFFMALLFWLDSTHTATSTGPLIQGKKRPNPRCRLKTLCASYVLTNVTLTWCECTMDVQYCHTPGFQKVCCCVCAFCSGPGFCFAPARAPCFRSCTLYLYLSL